MNTQLTYSQVQEYYGKVLKSSDDLQTDACCTSDQMPDFLKPILSKVHDEVLSRYYGCGLVLPEQLTGMRILDLGSGSGRDVYVLSALVGEQGSVVGVDMTDEQLSVARQYREYHAEQFGYANSNVDFKQGYIEALDQLGFEPSSFDLIVSNCVINLSPDKQAVLNQCYKLLKPGGEMYFSDVYAEQRVPQLLQDDQDLYGECISGALYWQDFIAMARATGFMTPMLVSSRALQIDNPSLQALIAERRFSSTTYRLCKIESADYQEEDYGQAVSYIGGIEHHQQQFSLAKDLIFLKNKITPVSANTFAYLKQSRLSAFFEFMGTDNYHFGPFKQCRNFKPDFETVVQSNKKSSCC